MKVKIVEFLLEHKTEMVFSGKTLYDPSLY